MPDLFMFLAGVVPGRIPPAPPVVVHPPFFEIFVCVHTAFLYCPWFPGLQR